MNSISLLSENLLLPSTLTDVRMVSSRYKSYHRRRNHKKQHNRIKRGKMIDVDKAGAIIIPSSSSSFSSSSKSQSENELISSDSPSMTPESTRIQEVALNGKDDFGINGHAKSKPEVVETSEVADSYGCPVNLRAVKDALNDIPPEYKETACTFSLAAISMVALFFSIVFYRYLSHLYSPEPEGFFCSYLARQFSPLFDALCKTEPVHGFVYEMKRNSRELAGELYDAAFGFIHSIFDGFHGYATIFAKLLEGLRENINYSIHELVGNVCENIAFLFRFCGQSVGDVLSTITNLGNTASDIFHAMSETN